MAEKLNPVSIDDAVTSAANGVLRALEARRIGAEKFGALDLVKSGFVVDIRIIAGGYPGPWLEGLLNKGGGPAGGPASRSSGE